jgi:Lactate dehydrogenase and related dehydrogenases
MKIVVLDGYTLNPGDLSWDALQKLGDVTIYDKTSDDLIITRSQGAQIILTNKTPLTDKVFQQLPDLNYIGVLATGYNVVEIENAKKRNIVVTNIPAYSTESVMQMTFALILELENRVQLHSDAVHDGAWTEADEFSFWKAPLTELAGKTLGLIGFGHIGQAVARVAEAFGMKILAYSAHMDKQTGLKALQWADKERLFRESDIISLHCPLFLQTQGMINKNSLNLMKQSALLINTARGALVVEQDLADALNEGKIAGAGLDVLSTEPPNVTNPLLTAKNCLITPHIAWATKEARTRLMHTAVENVKAFLENRAVNVINR